MADDKHDKTFKIHVNGVAKTIEHEVLTFEEVVTLAFGEPNPQVI